MKQKILHYLFTMLFLLICGVTFAAPAATIVINQPLCEVDKGSATITIAEDTKLEYFTYYFLGTGTGKDLQSKQN